MHAISKQEFKASLSAARSGADVSATPSPSATQNSVRATTVTMDSTAAGGSKAAASRRSGPLKEYRCPSVAEYRGTTATAKVPPCKSEAVDASQLSLPCGPVPEGFRNTHRTRNEITGHAAEAMLVGHGHIYSKANCSTRKGWKPGTF